MTIQDVGIHSFFPVKRLYPFMEIGKNSVNSEVQNWIGFASECKLLNFPSLMGCLRGTKKNAVSENCHPFDFLTWFQGNL